MYGAVHASRLAAWRFKRQLSGKQLIPVPVAKWVWEPGTGPETELGRVLGRAATLSPAPFPLPRAI